MGAWWLVFPCLSLALSARSNSPRRRDRVDSIVELETAMRGSGSRA